MEQKLKNNSDKKIKNFTEDTIVEKGKKDYKKISKKKKIKILILLFQVIKYKTKKISLLI